MHTGHANTEGRELFGEKYRVGNREYSVTEQDLTRLVDSLFSQQEEERRRLALDLHDDAAQRLAFIQVESERLAQSLGAGANLEFLRIGQEAAELGGSLRELSNRLYPAALEHLGLKVALEMLVDRWQDRWRARGHSIVLSANSETYEVPLAAALTLYRIVEEVLDLCNRQTPDEPALFGVANTPAKFELALCLRQAAAETELTMEGRGSGMNLAATLIGDKLGLLRIRQRASSVGGHLLLSNGSNSSTTLLIKVLNGTE